MSLHEEVKELDDWAKDPDEALDIGDIEASVFNQMVEVLGCFQPGDAAILQLFIDFLGNCKQPGHLTDTAPYTTTQGLDLMKRLQKAAEILEA